MARRSALLGALQILCDQLRIDYMQEKKVYLIREIRIEIESKIVTVEALIHESGLKRVFERSSLPFGLGDLMGTVCRVNFDGMSFEGRFSKELTTIGTFYNVRFLNISNRERDYISKEIAVNGLPAPWSRKFVRITTSADDAELPMPFLALGKGLAEGTFFNVLNFTLGGLLLQAPDGDSYEPRLNHEVIFDLVTNTGERIDGLKGVIMHINEDIDEKGGGRNITFGIRLTPMTMINEVRYNSLLKEYLTAYKKKMKMR